MELNEGDIVDVVCQTLGETVTADRKATNICDQLSDGIFVFDRFIKTGTDGLPPMLLSC